LLVIGSFMSRVAVGFPGRNGPVATRPEAQPHSVHLLRI
jgi:hypothetical protein